MRNWVLFYLGFLNCVAVGWFYKSDRQYRRVGKPAVLAYNIGCFMAVIVPTIVGKNHCWKLIGRRDQSQK